MITGGGAFYYKIWTYLTGPERDLARECMLEAYHDHCKNVNRKHKGPDLMDAVHACDAAWESAKAVLGARHVIFNPVDSKGKKKKMSAAQAFIKDITALEYAFSLTGWRPEPKCASLRHLNDEQKQRVVDTLETLIEKLKAYGVAERASR